MKQTSLIAFYVPKNTFLHRLQVAAKFLILFVYIASVIMVDSPRALLGISLLIVSATLILRLPLRNRTLVFMVITLLSLIVFLSPEMNVGARLVIAFGKIICLMLLLGLFTMTTKLNDILPSAASSSSVMPIFQPAIYLIGATLAALPSVQYDLQRAIDAESIRRGHKVRLYSPGGWITILTVTLTRTLTRAERWADTVTDRGYLLSSGLTPLYRQSFRFRDALLTALSVIPVLAILAWTL